MKILIIDDDLDVQDIFQIRLKKEGYEIVEAMNGEEGFKIAVQGGVDIILLDVMMPKIDGWEICKTLKSHPKTKDIPIIIITARAQPIDEMRSFESGADEYFAKPVEHEQLMQSINKLLKKKEQPKEAPDSLAIISASIISPVISTSVPSSVISTEGRNLEEQ